MLRIPANRMSYEKFAGRQQKKIDITCLIMEMTFTGNADFRRDLYLQYVVTTIQET